MTNHETTEYLSCTVERITYHNSENGFCVLRIRVKGYKELVTITGNTPSVSAGEYIKCNGGITTVTMANSKAAFLKSLPPDTLEGIERYLGSGLIKPFLLSNLLYCNYG